MNTMKNLSDALTAAGASVRTVGGDVLFVNAWAIHCTLTGTVQARNVWDSHERFGVGKVTDPADALAATILSLP